MTLFEVLGKFWKGLSMCVCPRLAVCERCPPTVYIDVSETEAAHALAGLRVPQFFAYSGHIYGTSFLLSLLMSGGLGGCQVNMSEGEHASL